MADFQGIVRRAQSAVDVTPPQRVLASGATDKPNVVLVIGKASGNGGSNVKTLSKSFSYSLTTYMDKQQKEITSNADGTF
ncbi:hypothetical protein [Bradyrhizobium sp. RDM4]|uniref:hypothetical protein n=1 Tax=Bradyrhizobium sp. RDM4 TaxID=3378765 RepID=UPI0038FC9725